MSKGKFESDLAKLSCRMTDLKGEVRDAVGLDAACDLVAEAKQDMPKPSYTGLINSRQGGIALAGELSEWESWAKKWFGDAQK